MLMKTCNSVINRNKHKKEFIPEKEGKKHIQLGRDLKSGIVGKNTNNYYMKASNGCRKLFINFLI